MKQGLAFDFGVMTFLPALAFETKYDEGRLRLKLKSLTP